MEHKDEYEQIDNPTSLLQMPDINYDDNKIVHSVQQNEKLEEAKDEEKEEGNEKEEEGKEESTDGAVTGVEGIGVGTEHTETDRISYRSSHWHLFGRIVPKNELIFLSQVFILYIVIISCIVNLSLNIGESNMWTALLSSSLGIMLPQPTLSKKNK